QIPALVRQYTDLQRELQVATESLNRFLATRETLQIEEAQTEIPWQLIQSPARPQKPISPNIPRGLLMGAAAGVLLGVASALLMEKLDNAFHSPKELKEKTKLPLLGVIPFNQQLQTVQEPTRFERMAQFFEWDIPELILPPQYASRAYGGSSFLEAFRSLYANIRFLGSDTPIRSLTISSALPGDGKSTVSIQLAKAAAAMGQRVLLVDADLRRPQVHDRLGLSNSRGLSNLISTQLTLQDVIQTAPDSSELFVITAGQIPPDPTKLLSSKKMQHLVEQVQGEFDLVIYDTPPLVGLADASLLAAHMDGMLLVVGLGKTDSPTVMQALDRLKVSQTQVLGTVVNNIKQDIAHPAYGYHHYYYRNSESPVHKGNGAHNGATTNGKHH
ncbi:MAG: polysaccharide biosynthesis tyrosine autokinase, partial [Leptolyngbyaceae cyanobacterium MO_188.B28]|nr:polysaccharide biosynthesis tyrosine autokinase [Leptolyngbyaceae cyanobacterium MO_188.B28]